MSYFHIIISQAHLLQPFVDDLDEAAIQTKMGELAQSMHALSTKLYEAAAAEMAEQQEDDSGDDVVDADFEVVDSEEDES